MGAELGQNRSQVDVVSAVGRQEVAREALRVERQPDEQMLGADDSSGASRPTEVGRLVPGQVDGLREHHVVLAIADRQAARERQVASRLAIQADISVDQFVGQPEVIEHLSGDGVRRSGQNEQQVLAGHEWVLELERRQTGVIDHRTRLVGHADCFEHGTSLLCWVNRFLEDAYQRLVVTHTYKGSRILSASFDKKRELEEYDNLDYIIF